MLISLSLLVFLAGTCKTENLRENQIDDFSEYQCNSTQPHNSLNFTLTSSNFPRPCRFEVTKTNRRICKLDLNFRYFFLGSGDCEDEYLEIDGKYFCGCNSGLRIRVDFEEGTKILNYKISTNSEFVIEVNQVECPGSKIIWPKDDGTIEKLDLVQHNTIEEPKIVKDFYVYEGRKELEELDVITSDGSSECTKSFESPDGFKGKRKEELFLGKFFRTCVDLDYVKGYFRSPGYPFFYPRNVNLCYKFRKQPGYCSVEVTMHDFHLEQSNDCKKDYFLVGSKRYCGRSLVGKTWLVDPGEAVRFVSDSFWSCRGFSGIFRHVPCRKTPTTCDETIERRVFRIKLARDCVFTINKVSEDVCRLKLKFESVDLRCDKGNLTIGQDVFCGNLSGKEVSFDFNNVDSIKIVYWSSPSYQSSSDGVTYEITGEQVETCTVPEPAPERLIEYHSTAYLIKSRRDFCRLVKRREKEEKVEKICEFFLENPAITSCTRVDLNSDDVPYEVETLNINGKFETIQYREIDCDQP